MMTPLWVSETADAFWKAAGGLEPFPRNLRIPIANALPLTVVLLPRLRVIAVDAWLRARAIACATASIDRALRACLVARHGQGFIFVDGLDPEDEQRFSVAHELAHFLREYWQPRQDAIQRLGPSAREVLDGERPPTPEERIHGLLARVRLDFHVHLMERTPDGRFADATVGRAEHDADLLAFELLAPACDVLAGLAACTAVERRARVRQRLIGVFGLPSGPAERYARLLIPEAHAPASLLQRLGLIDSS